MNPADLAAIVDIAQREARLGLLRFKDSTGAAEAARAVENFGRRMADLAERWAAGKMAPGDLGRALESEREALTYTLAAIEQENRRAFLAGLFDTLLRFAGALIGTR